MQEEVVPVVWIPNNGPHDYSPALKFGELKFLTEGYIYRTNVTSLWQDVYYGKLQFAKPEDYLMVTSLPIINVISACLLMEKFGEVNLLIYSRREYLVRKLFSLDNLPQEFTGSLIT